MAQTISTLVINSILVISIILIFCHAGVANDAKPTNVIDSLKRQLEVSENDERFQILLKLTERTRRLDPDQAESYILDAREYVDESSVNQKLFDYYEHIGGVKISQNLFEESIELLEYALHMEFDGLDLKDHIRVYELMATAEKFLGNNVMAQAALFSGLRLADSLHQDTLKVSLYNTIGTVYHSMEDSIMSEKYFLLAIDLAKKIGEKHAVLRAQGNLAILYTNQKRYDDAEKIILETIQLLIKTGDRTILGSNYNNLAVIYGHQKKYKISLEYLYKALKIDLEDQRKSSIALRYMNIGDVHMKIKNYDLAKENLDKGIKIAAEVKNKDLYLLGLYNSSEYYEAIGNHKEALNYHRKYTTQNDSFLSESRINAVAELRQKYESEKKEKEILVLSNEKALAEKRERTLIQAILLLCLGIVSLGGLIYFLRQNLIKNSIIQKKNLKIASDKIQLLEKGKEIIALESLVKGQENERERLAKEMHDGLGGLLAISHSKLTNLNTSELTANMLLNEACDLIGDAYDQVRQISHNLMPLDLEKFGIVEALKNMIQRINQQNDIIIDFRTYHFDLMLNNELGLNIYRISQEALTNILKFAKAKNVLIELIQHEKTISLSIEDDGIGFDLNTEDSGIGIRNMRNRTELLNGTFCIESRVSEGTTISILFPTLLNEPNLIQT